MGIVTEKTIKRIPPAGISEERFLAHINSNPIEHADNSITLPKIKYQTENVSFAYLAANNRLVYAGSKLEFTTPVASLILTKDIFTDKAVIALGFVNQRMSAIARYINATSYYRGMILFPVAGNDFQLRATNTILASEAADLADHFAGILITCTGSSIKCLRYEITEPIDPLNLPAPNFTLSVINTGFANGRFGYVNLQRVAADQNVVPSNPSSVYLLPPMSPSPPILDIYEVEITGDGSPDNPFRPNLPKLEEIVDKAELDKYDVNLQQAILLNKDKKVDRLALSWSAFIPIDENGIPTEKTCLVFIFEQPNRQPHLYSVKECLDEIEKRPEVKKHGKGSAKAEMFKRDKKLAKERDKKEKEVDEFLGIK
jgi:hypothetical protein